MIKRVLRRLSGQEKKHDRPWEERVVTQEKYDRDGCPSCGGKECYTITHAPDGRIVECVHCGLGFIIRR